MNIQSIKETLIPPIVATIISIGLISDWSSAEASDSASVTDDSMTTASRSMKRDSHLEKMGHSRVGSGDAMLIRTVYRLPLLTGQRDKYTQTRFLQRAMVATDCPAFVNIQCWHVLYAVTPARIWWM